MPYFHSATFALNVPPNFIVSSLIFAFVSDTEDGAKKLFVNNVLPSASFTCSTTEKTSLCILGCKRIFDLFLDILDGNESF